MSMTTGVRQVATLWNLSWDTDSLSCVVYRTDTGFQLNIESPVAVILTEPFEMQPRALVRAHALRDALKRRGWQDSSN
jgi:hypothetical protein